MGESNATPSPTNEQIDALNLLTYTGLQQYNTRLLAQIQNAIGAVGSIPTGSIVMWSGSDVPSGWALCDGQNGTPDLRDRFVIGASSTRAVGSTGGSDKVTLTEGNLPAHTHDISGATFTDNGQGGSLFSGGEDEIKTGTSVTGATGDGDPISIMPPYYALAFIMKI